MSIALIFISAILLGPGTESDGLYAAVLSAIREDVQDRPLVLNTVVPDSECFPHCKSPADVDSISPELISSLRTQGVIEGSCTSAPNDLGCEGVEPSHVMVTFGTTESAGDTAVVNVVLAWGEEYRGRPIPVIRGYRYRLCERSPGEWIVLSSELTWLV